MEGKRVYLDHAATTPLSEAALSAMTECFREGWGNASSLYQTGRRAKARLEQARRDIARCMGVSPEEIYFTSGGSESDNWAVKGVMTRFQPGQAHLITTAIEHPALLNACAFLEKQGYEMTWVSPDARGRIDPEDVRKAVRTDTKLISVMAANNEVGTVEPIREIAALAHEQGVPVHTDAVQMIGLFPRLAEDSGADMLSLSAHKFGGPKGIGLLYIRKGTKIEPLIHGGEQERGFRASTENVPSAVGMAAAFLEAARDAESHINRLTKLRVLLLDAIRREIPDVIVNGDPEHHLPGHLHLTIPGVRDEALIPLLDLNGVEASAGSACTAGSFVESHVLKAMGVPGNLLRSSLRLTLSPAQTEEELLYAAQVIARTAQKLRKH
ncbi:MAG TPA: cysteine desulfurase NifS [Desulfovibrio sp.]|nr:cysteine desulfurase NifS [Desulfovibrio sp.]